jgi:hypothetical protein
MVANKQLQRTVMDKVPRHVSRYAAAELRRYTAEKAGGESTLDANPPRQRTLH